MTCIAWDGKTLAGDRQMSFGGTPIPYRKVYRYRHKERGLILFGCAGKTGECHTYERWAMGKIKDQPKFSELNVLSVVEGGKLWGTQEDMHWYPIDMPFFAIGTGADYALGAMAAGKSAREAVKIAMRLDNNCGVGIDVVRF